MISPYVGAEVAIDNYADLQARITEAAIGSQETGLYALPALFAPEIAQALINFATIAITGNPKGPPPTNVDYSLTADHILRRPAKSEPHVAEALSTGMRNSFDALHPKGARVIKLGQGANMGAPNTVTNDWHVDAWRFAAVVIAPNPLALRYAKSIAAGRRGESQTLNHRSAIIGIKGPGSVFNLKRKGVAHSVDNPAPTWRHSVVGHAILRAHHI